MMFVLLTINRKTTMKNIGKKSWKLSRFGYLILLVMFLITCKSSKPIVDQDPVPILDYAFNFVQSDNLSSVLKKAERENKLVFVDVYTTWCLPCKMMDQDVFTHQATADIFNKDYISYKVDAEKNNGLIIAFNYDVIEYPTLLFLDTKGKVLERKEGAAYHTELLALAKSALDQVVIGE